jgi:hypothetical protein
MYDAKKPMTHIVWAQHYQGTRFREWVEIGRARVETDESGNTVAHSYTNRIPRGDSGYTCLLPIGIKPRDPPANPKRPGEGPDSNLELDH